jgi:hypothetical protein
MDAEPDTTHSPQRWLPLFEHYAPGHRLAPEIIRHTRHAAWLTGLMAAAFIWAFWPDQHLLNWAILGLATGTGLMVAGALNLSDQPDAYGLKWTPQLVASRTAWFPYLLFAAQTVYLFCLVALIWFALPELGVPLNPGLHISMFALLTLITLRRLIGEWARQRAKYSTIPLREVLHLSTTMLVTLLVAIAASHAVSPFGHPITGDNTLPLVLIWLSAVFVLLCALIMLIDRLQGGAMARLQRRKKSVHTAPATSDRPVDRLS